MSRTIRRTGADAVQKNFYRDTLPEDVSLWALHWSGLADPRIYLAQQHARFHRDHRSGRYGVPSWYRRRRNKRVARQNRAELHRCIKLDCWDDHLPVPCLSDAGWYWW